MYAKQGDKILDTHLGSGTIAIACYNAGISLTGCEISENYFEKSLEKIKNHLPGVKVDTSIPSAYSIQFPNQEKESHELNEMLIEHNNQLRIFKEAQEEYLTKKV